jgi:hypothetical protein
MVLTGSKDREAPLLLWVLLYEQNIQISQQAYLKDELFYENFIYNYVSFLTNPVSFHQIAILISKLKRIFL